MAGNIQGVTDFTGIRVGGGSSTTATASNVSDGVALLGILSGTSTFAAVSLTATQSSDRTIPLPGARAGDGVLLGLPSGLSAGVAIHGFVSADNIVTVRFSNVSTAAANQTAQPVRATVFRHG